MQKIESIIHNSGSHARFAGRDYHEHHHAIPDVADPWFRELQHRFAPHARDPRCMHCDHCDLRGQPPLADECLFCHHDIGAARRAREACKKAADEVRAAAAERRQRWLRITGNLRFGIALTAGFAGVSLMLLRYPDMFDKPWDYFAFGVLMLIAITGAVDTGILWLHIKLACDLPRWLIAHRLGWLLREGSTS